ncbi:phosphoadenylyl-sulfate reductase [Methylovirgula ligni]|uniref:Adenosine 5'-phosphosulfate reductase n=1 Tax=Methylovirgula ligni TaxID=569860 RepID=A0A3D9Z2B0_9HYPH|nr:phosphoadenylyl-sulfate reductase [Methylovirgula ligni]QAY96831.1 phosphoadenylyl-sulfate reductase [Methylovirgula ligni]REF88130.1 phosphoadenosine phosphosulfate reductase [Methylovirgula ligni]
MSVLEAPLFGDQIAASRLSDRFYALGAEKLLRLAIQDLFTGRIALVSSFGADSAVLLHMVAQIDKATPVLFLDTLHLFPETLAYRDALVDRLGLTRLITLKPDLEELSREDPENFQWSSDPDRCCALRKVVPLAKALANYDAWITGRKRFQAATRAALPLFESDGPRIKLNPLATWTQADIKAYFEKYDLPEHPLVAKNFLSIGCLPCTSPVRPGEDARSGRWRGRGKTECGVHIPSVLEAGADI